MTTLNRSLVLIAAALAGVTCKPTALLQEDLLNAIHQDNPQTVAIAITV